MKKIISIFLIAALMLSLSAGLNLNLEVQEANIPAPVPFANELKQNSGVNGSSLVLHNAQGLGTTTLFSGTGVTAQGTVNGQSINFNIYGDDSSSSQIKVGARQEYYLIPENRAFINTGIVPNGETTLEIFYMLPNNFVALSEGAAHPDVAGCNANNNAAMHFGGPLLLNGGSTQFLYGTWPANSNILQATFPWAQGGHYHSILSASGGVANVSLTDGVNTYSASLSENISGHSFNSLYLFGQNNNGGLVNPVKVGIKEVKITQNGDVKRHFFAVPQGSTEFSSVAAPSNCMYDVVSGTYFQNQNSGATFNIQETSGNVSEIDISSVIGGGLGGEIVASGD